MIFTRRLLTLATSAAVLLNTAHSQTRPSIPPVTANVQAPNPGGAAVDYSRESSIIERMDTIYRYAADDTGSKEITAVVHIEDEAAVKAWSVLTFVFASSSEHVEIDYVRVRRPDGDVVETPAADAQEMPAPITREAPFYSDIKEKQIPVRSLGAGDRLEYRVRIVRTRAEAPGHFWGEETFFTPLQGGVVLAQTMEIHVPKTAYIQVWSPKYKSTLAETGTEKVYSWHTAQVIPIAGMDKEALKKLQAPQPDEDEDGRFPSVAWTNFHDWPEVGAWYRNMEGTRIAPDDEVKAKVAELIAGTQTPEEKIRALYNYVGPQIRYIGVAFGVGRYQPHEAADVLRNQYGDCKDKHTLLAAMLSAAGFTADAALIGSGVRFNEAVPSPGAFNHVITVVQLDGKPIWLDSTAEVAPFRMLMPAIRDKQALVVPASGAAHIERSPKDLPFKAEIRFDADGSIDEHGTSHSHIVMVLRGDEEVLYRSAVRSVSPAQWDDLMQNISQAMSWAGKVSHTEFSRPDDTAGPFHVAYDYEREKSGDWDNYRILAQLPPAGLSTVDEKDPPVSSIELGTPHVETDHAVMKPPPGWSADLPPAIHAKSVYATLDKTYKFEDGKLITDRRIEILQRKVPAADWRTYQKWATAAGLDGEPFIQLNRGDGSSQPTAGVNDPKAADLISEVVRLENEHNWEEATAKLDQAKTINPKQAYLWSSYGYIALMYGKPIEATEDFRRELADHPGEDNVSLMLAGAQMQQHKPQEAIATLQALVLGSPDNENAVNLLANLLLEDKQYPAAEKALRASLGIHPDNAGIQLMLSTALLRQGKKTEATVLLQGVAKKSDDSLTLNNAAYALADEGLDLPLAETSARHALALMEQQVADAQTGETERATLLRTEMVLSVWDTLGWALFREGKTAEAEPFVRAAWTNGLAGEPGYHLGMVLEKEGQRVQAMTVYQLALFGDKGSNSDIVANKNLERQSALEKAGTPKQVSDAKMALQARRTFKVPGGNAATGWATVDVELSAGAPPNARAVPDGKNSDAVAATVKSLSRIDFKADIPAGSHAKIVRRGILSCHAGTPCELVLLSSHDGLMESSR